MLIIQTSSELIWKIVKFIPDQVSKIMCIQDTLSNMFQTSAFK